MLEKSSIFFRFGCDVGTEKVEFYGREIAVCDLKQAIAERYKFSKYDLSLLNDSTNEPYARESTLLPKNITVVVKRTPVQSIKEPVLHLEGANIWSNFEKAKPVKKKKVVAPIKRVACPPEYLCPLCKEMYDNPCIARCCGRSACFNCFEVQPDELHCPLCGKTVTDETTPIPNPKLFDTVASLNLEYFDLPGGRMPQLPAKSPEVVDLDEDDEAPKAEPQQQVERLPSTEAPPVVPPQIEQPLATASAAGPGLPPPELLARAWSGNVLPGHPASPPPFPWSPPPSPLPVQSPILAQPVAVFPQGMMSAEQFALWQQSLPYESYSDYSDSDDRQRKKKKKKKESKKHKKEKKRLRSDFNGSAVSAAPVVAAEHPQKAHRKSKRRRDNFEGMFQ